MDRDLEQAKRALLEAIRRDLGDTRVVQAMAEVPREAFVPPGQRHLAYEDTPLPIGEGQTISQPYIVALMASALELRDTDKVLEIGTGSGYQAAVLARLVPQGRVVTMERLPSLAAAAARTLRDLGFANVEVRPAGRVLGCPEEAPFDAIIVAAAAPTLPHVLLEQLASGGRMVVPVGSLVEQQLFKVVKTGEGHFIRVLGPCRFVPLIGEGAWRPEDFPPPT